MRSEQGITIIETTVILSVLFILAGVLSPIVSESVMTARAVKAKNDASMIAMGLINFQKDLGADALAYGGAAAFGGAAVAAVSEALRLPDVLISAGAVPAVDDDAESDGLSSDVTLALFARPGGGGGAHAGGGLSSRAQRRKWREGPAQTLDDHLIHNRVGYRYRRPGEYGGWNGPYLSAPIPGDPWGNQYLVNTQFLDGGTTAADSTGRVRRAVFVVSAGGNGVVETPFEQPIVDARAFGDDIVIRLQ